MFYIGAMFSIVSLYLVYNWGFYIPGWVLAVIVFLAGTLFLCLAHKNAKNLAKQKNKRFAYQLLPIGLLTILGGVVLLLTIRLVGNTCEGFGWVLTTDQGWQTCPKNLAAGSAGGIIVLMCLFIFLIISLATYSLCDYKK